MAYDLSQHWGSPTLSGGLKREVWSCLLLSKRGLWDTLRKLPRVSAAASYSYPVLCGKHVVMLQPEGAGMEPRTQLRVVPHGLCVRGTAWSGKPGQ